MTTVALNTGLKSLLTAQYVLDTIGHNIANANTPGYSRQRVDVGTALPLSLGGFLVGGGVDATGVRRSVDSLLTRRILGQVSVGGRLQAQLSGMTEIEAMLGELEGDSIGGHLDAFFSGVSELTTDPEDPILRSSLAQAATSMAARFRGLDASLGDLGRDVRGEIALRVEDVNRLADRVLQLNLEIAAAEGGGTVANDLRDSRDLAIEELAKLVDVTAVEDASGSMLVLVAGNTLVSSSRTYELELGQDPGGAPALQIEGAAGFVPVTGGSIGGQLRVASQAGPDLRGELDRLARSLLLEVNRAHSTGVPSSGGFRSLTADNPIADRDGDGSRLDELLSNAGLPFDVTSGSLHVNVVDDVTGDVVTRRIDLTSTHTTVGAFVGALNDVPHLSADVDAFGRLRLVADSGYRFDFSRRLDATPDTIGSFGGARASLGTPGGEPFALSDGATLQVTVPAGGTPLTIAFDAADFEDVEQATAEEVAAAINADPGAQAAGLAAAAVGDRLVLQTLAEGASASFTVDGGSALGALGWDGLAGSAVTGHDGDVDVVIGGAYGADVNDRLTFVPSGDGVVGTTPGLSVDVFDGDGNKVATLPVGEGYVPGEPLEVFEGVTVSFGLGELSATHNDAFSLDVIGDPDSTDVLVALGLNSFFTGTGAADLALRDELEIDPGLIATSGTGAPGDASTLLGLLDAQDAAQGDLDGASFGQFYGSVVAGFGFEMSSTRTGAEANAALVQSLETLRTQASGVNVDEELVDLVRYEQAFAAASQYISVVNQLADELLSMI